MSRIRLMLNRSHFMLLFDAKFINSYDLIINPRIGHLKSMKTVVLILLLMAIGGTMILTNPTIDDYSAYMQQEIVNSTRDKDDFSRGLALLFGGLAGSVVSHATKRTNFVFFSIYHTDLKTEKFRCLGIFGNFVNCDGEGQGTN